MGNHGDANREYRIGITDNPTAELTLYANGRTKKVVDYPPCHYDDAAPELRPPRALCELERAVDELANSKQWVSCRDDAGAAAACPGRFEPPLPGSSPLPEPPKPSPAPRLGCDPPWWIDDAGRRLVKQECM